MTKKKRIIILSIFASIFIIFVAFFIAVCIKVGYVPVKIENIYDNVYKTSTLDIEAENETFKILKISDTHLINGKTNNDLKTLAHIESALDNRWYDLIILNGDIIDGFNLNFAFNKYAAIDSIAAILENTQILWTFVPGNNDGEMQGDNKKLISYLMQFEHFITGNTQNVDGDVNFTLNIYYKAEIVHTIIFLDSHARKIPIIGSYEHFKESQINYVQKISKKQNNYLGIFFHMPTAAFQKAFDEGIQNSEYTQFASKRFDQIKDSNLFDKGIEDCSNISLISSSHIHSNNMLAFYNGRYYESNSASGIGAQRDEDIVPTVTEININLLASRVESLYTFSQF